MTVKNKVNKTKGLKPVYLIYSEQKFLISEALKRLKAQISAQSMGSLNIIEFEWPFDFEELEQALNTVGFFDQRKIIIVNQADKFSEKEIQKINRYLKVSNPSVSLVLVALKKNEALFNKARGGRFFFEYKAPKKGQLAQWVADRFKKGGKKASFEAASYLVDLVGEDLASLSQEIEKIVLYSGSKENLGPEDISAVSQNIPHETIFDLVDALGQADLSLALWHLNNLLLTEKEGKIFRMVVRQFRLLLKAKGLFAEGLNLAQIAKTLGLPPFITSKYLKQAKHFSITKLSQAHKILLEAEVAYKTSGSSFKKVLELALVKILAA